MKLKTLYLENFRCYKDRIGIDFDDLTTFIGKNDIGKSSIFEALEIFFNNNTVKIDASDRNIHGNNEVVITCDFCDLPCELVLDSGEKTNLSDEYLTIDDDLLRIKKVYDCSKSKITPMIYIVAKHPNALGVENLLSLKEKELQKIIKDKGIDSTLKGNPSMRKAIWNSVGNLELTEKEIEISKAKEDEKNIWMKIDSYLPNYALFQSDRSSQDSDGEVQNPMKAAIQEAIAEVQLEIDAIQERVRKKAMYIAEQTQQAIRKIDENLAKELTPHFTPPTTSKWNGLFSISMDTDEGIPLNKRGSGIRRMILVGFFKAEAERKAAGSHKKNIIYAIEEPETAQHPNNQRILINSFLELSKSENCQVLLTTHSPSLAQELPIESLRFITREDGEKPIVLKGEDILPSIAETLGVFPHTNDNVQVILCVEGPTDVIALKAFNRCLREKHKDMFNLEEDNRVLIIPLGGSTLKYWVEKRYLNRLNCPEVHIYDNDVKKYKDSIDKINERKDGSWGALTKKYEIENYLHPDAIKSLYDVDVDTDQENLPSLVAEAFYEKNKNKLDNKWKDNTTKQKLSRVFQEKMSYGLLIERDPDEEIKGWFDKIASMLQ